MNMQLRKHAYKDSQLKKIK